MRFNRFNKLQQVWSSSCIAVYTSNHTAVISFLFFKTPFCEDGTITLLGATTENPSFQLNFALLSRCRVIVLEKLKSPQIENLLRRALPKVGAVEKTTAY